MLGYLRQECGIGSSLNVALGIVSQSRPICMSSNKAVADARVRGKTLILTGYVFETGSGPHGCSGERGYPVKDIGTLCGCP